MYLLIFTNSFEKLPNLCKTRIFNFFQEFVGVTVDYITVPGWKSNIAGCKGYEDLPINAKKYVETIEQYLNIPGILILFIVNFFSATT